MTARASHTHACAISESNLCFQFAVKFYLDICKMPYSWGYVTWHTADYVMYLTCNVCFYLISFLREPWSMTIYHDRFTDLQQEIVELLRTPLVSLSSPRSHDLAYRTIE